MPRKAKTRTGEPGQAIREIPGQYYGAGVEQQELQAAMPTPASRQPVSSAPAPAAQPEAAPVDLMAIAKQMQGGPGMLRQPSARPNEPVTAGLSRGPGPGPEVLQMNREPRFVQTMQDLSNTLGDPYFADLARRVSRR